jgi:hypothetical protein
MSCRATAESVAHQFGHGGYAAAVTEALTFRALFRHIFATASPRRDCTVAHALFLASARPSAERDAPDRPLLSAHSFACAAVPHRHAQQGGPTLFVVMRPLPHDALRMRLPAHSAGPHAWRFRPILSWRRRRRCVPSRCQCTSGWAVAPAIAHWSTDCERTARRAGAFWGSFCVRIRFESVSRSLKKSAAEKPKIGCAQLAAIKRDAAVAALVADVMAKNLDASPVDLLLSVKVRCRRCTPLSVLGGRSVPWSATSAGVLEYPSSPMSTHAARTSTTDCTGVLHSVVECA